MPYEFEIENQASKKLEILDENDRGYLIFIPFIGQKWIGKGQYEYYCLLYEDLHGEV